MMQELRLVLIILGAVAIAALLLHGLWTSRKEKPAKFGEKPIGKLTGKDDTGFDQDGIGSVRVIKSGDDTPKVDRKEPGLSFGDKSDVDPLFVNEMHSDDASAPDTRVENDLESNVVTNDVVVDTKEEAFDLPAFSASDNDAPSFTVDEPRVEAELVVVEPKKTSNDFYQTASSYDEDVVDKPVKGAVAETTEEQDIVTVDEEPEAAPEPQQQVLILNVQAGNNQEFDGTELINCLEQHGLLYGEMEIFHRHADLAGTGKVLFSAANMFNPGSFPLETIHQFTTPGISLFMTLPCYGEADQNFKLMLQTAQQVADQLGGLVTDDSRTMMTPQRIDTYRDKIKKFHSPA
ncbi:cell division protein ZipA [Enterovibrio norvegicus]|uniref:cell division protein ZipA n=1 Tax=Enterovibrio norvegicus TaxID=188144 RepID=UPI00354F69BB